jgi:FtsP/CotA-like multicopper oxidase with cupredoxin domain
MSRFIRFSILPLALIIGVGLTVGGLRVGAQDASKPARAAHDELREPVVLASKDGVLELTLTPHQGTAQFDTVPTPTKKMLVFRYRLERGTSSNGQSSGDNLYPAPTLQVWPGQTLIVHLNNELAGLTIRDYYNPAYTPKGEQVPIYAPMLTSSPFNLHVHGVHVSPRGNSDNVLLDVQAGMSNTYVYHIPNDMPQGAYWYHSHLHTLTMLQTYLGLAGLLEIGRVDGNLPIVTQRHIPVRNMILQENAVFDRRDGLAEISNYNWPKEGVSTLAVPKGTQLADGTYRPSLAPVNFTDSPKGTKYTTVWWAGPPGSHDNNRGVFQFMPANVQAFKADGGNGAHDLPAEPNLPDAKRDVQFTVNGQFEPVVRSKAGQTEIWVLENISDMAYINVELTETATGGHPKIAVVGQDGNPFLAVHYPPTAGGTELLIPPASRTAIAVTMPERGDLVLSMPPYGRGTKAMTLPAILYTNNGTQNSPAVLGSETVLPSAISYNDGFFVFPSQELARATTSGGQGESTAFAEGQKLHAYTSFVDLSHVKPDVRRTLLINGGFLNNYASTDDPKSFVYAFDGNAFPYIPLIQPRLGSVEEWNFVNHNNDEHPIHVHVNDFQVTKYYDPTTGLRTGPDMWGEDNANVPAPTMGAHETVVSPGELSMRTKFEEYTGTYVLHCHRLNHEDNGLMALINVIPAVSAYAVAVPGSSGHPAKVRVYDGKGDRLITTLTPFPSFDGSLSVAMGDTESTGVLDLIVGTGKGASPQVAVYSGKSGFRKEIARFAPFAADERGGVSVASAQIDGSTADNIIVGSPARMQDRINVYALERRAEGEDSPKLFTSFVPFENDRSGVTVAAGLVDLMSGRYSIVAAPGPGSPAVVKVFKLWLLTPIPGFPSQVDATEMHQDSQGPVTTATFQPFGADYRGGVSLGVGWIAGSLGGAQSIVVGQRTDGGVAVYSSGNALQGAPKIYLHDPQMHDYHIAFGPIARLHPFGGDGGVAVGTTATTVGADLLVSGTPDGKGVSVAKYELFRASKTATSLSAKRIHVVESTRGAQPEALGGN